MLGFRFTVEDLQWSTEFCVFRCVSPALKKNCTYCLGAYSEIIFATYVALAYGRSLPCTNYQSERQRWKVTVFHALGSQKFSQAFFHILTQIISTLLPSSWLHLCVMADHIFYCFRLAQVQTSAPLGEQGVLGTQFFKRLCSLLWIPHAANYTAIQTISFWRQH